MKNHKLKPILIIIISLIGVFPMLIYAGDIYLLAMNANVAGLKYTHKDRERIVNSFRAVYGTKRLTVYQIHNVTRFSYNKAMQMYKQVIKPSDHLIIYFSGHGTLVVDRNNDEADGYDEALVGYSRRGRMSRKQTILDDLLANDVRQINPRELTVILDTCHSGGMLKSITNKKDGLVKKFVHLPIDTPRLPKTKNFHLNEGIKGFVDAASGTLYAASTERQAAYEYNRANLKGGVFTKYFAAALQRTGSLDEAFSIARKKVANKTKGRQTPQKYHYPH